MSQDWAARSLRRHGLMVAEAGGPYPDRVIRQLLWEAQDGRCMCCGRILISRFRDRRSGDQDTLDHVWPKGAGGPDRPGNYALMTRNCNNRKGSRLPTPEELAALDEINARLGWRTPRFVW